MSIQITPSSLAKNQIISQPYWPAMVAEPLMMMKFKNLVIKHSLKPREFFKFNHPPASWQKLINKIQKQLTRSILFSHITAQIKKNM